MRTIHQVATASIYGELTILQAGTGRKLVSVTLSPTQPQEQGRPDPHVWRSPLSIRGPKQLVPSHSDDHTVDPLQNSDTLP